MSIKHMLLAFAFAPLAMGAAAAQDWKPSSATVVPPGAPLERDPAAPSRTDAKGPALNALRYYAHGRDLTRVAAEIRRIQLEYPNWTPPDDLYSDAKPRVDEQPLWDLYLNGDYVGIEAKIAEMKQANADWKPTHDFTDKYEHAKASAEIIAKSDDKQWSEVVKIASTRDGLVNCNEIDLAWRIAEGFARSGDEVKATEIYAFLLNSCSDQPARLGTMQKASTVLGDPAKVDRLIALGKPRPDGTNEFASIVEDRTRTDLGDFAAAKSTTPVAPERVEAFEKATKASKNAADALLLGWYYRKTKDSQKALAWTRAAFEGEANPKTAEAYALALRESYHFDDAERLTYDWREKGDQFRKMYIDIVSTSITAHGHDAEIMRKQSERETLAQVPAPKALTGGKTQVYGQSLNRPIVYCGQQRALTQAEIERLGRFKVEVEADKSAVGGQALGWRLYEANLSSDAASWFEHSMVWEPNEPAAVGLAVTAKRSHRMNVYHALIAKYGELYPGLLLLDARQRSCIRTAGTVGRTAPPDVSTNGRTPQQLYSSLSTRSAGDATAAEQAAKTDALEPDDAGASTVLDATAAHRPSPEDEAPMDVGAFLAPSDVTPEERRAAAETNAPPRVAKPRAKLHSYVVRGAEADAPPRPHKSSATTDSQSRSLSRWYPPLADSPATGH